MEKKKMKHFISFISITTLSVLFGSVYASAETIPYEDSAESEVDIVIKEDSNVGDDHVFKFDSVPEGFSFVGDTGKAVNNKVDMVGKIEGSINKIGLKTDIENADKSNFKVTGAMDSVRRKSDGKTFSVDTFKMKFGSKDVDVKSGIATIMDKDTSSKDDTSSNYYSYLYSNEIAQSNLTLSVDDTVKKGDEFSGNLVYTLTGSIDFT